MKIKDLLKPTKKYEVDNITYDKIRWLYNANGELVPKNSNDTDKHVVLFHVASLGNGMSAYREYLPFENYIGNGNANDNVRYSIIADVDIEPFRVKGDYDPYDLIGCMFRLDDNGQIRETTGNTIDTIFIHGLTPIYSEAFSPVLPMNDVAVVMRFYDNVRKHTRPLANLTIDQLVDIEIKHHEESSSSGVKKYTYGIKQDNGEVELALTKELLADVNTFVPAGSTVMLREATDKNSATHHAISSIATKYSSISELLENIDELKNIVFYSIMGGVFSEIEIGTISSYHIITIINQILLGDKIPISGIYDIKEMSSDIGYLIILDLGIKIEYGEYTLLKRTKISNIVIFNGNETELTLWLLSNNNHVRGMASIKDMKILIDYVLDLLDQRIVQHNNGNNHNVHRNKQKTNIHP